MVKQCVADIPLMHLSIRLLVKKIGYLAFPSKLVKLIGKLINLN